MSRMAQGWPGLGLLGLLWMLSLELAAQPDSRYSPIDPASCQTLSESEQEQRSRCPAHADWQVWAVSDPERSWLELERDGKVWSTASVIQQNRQLGQFAGLAGSPLEWRSAGKAAAHALIFRVAGQQAEPPSRSLSRLLVLRLSAQSVDFCGLVSTNLAARQLADNPLADCSALERRDTAKPGAK